MFKQIILTPFSLCCLSTAAFADSSDPRDVEIGVGGDLRPEKVYRTELEESFQWNGHLMWESRYITEGRDNLSGAGLYSASTEFTVNSINIVPWIAKASEGDYEEFNLNVVYGSTIGENLEFHFAYNHLRSKESGDSANDDEFSVDTTYFFGNGLQLSGNVYYSFDAEGAFSELALIRNQKMGENINTTIRALVGFNSGYVADGHDGLNHFELHVRASYQVSKALETYGYLSVSYAINESPTRYEGDSPLRDLSWGGFGFSFYFG